MKINKLKHRQKVFFVCSSALLVFICLVLVFIVCSITAWKNRKGTFVWCDTMRISSNEDYIGFIDTENEKVIILNHSGKEVSYVDFKGSCPNQIALGEEFYFLLYQWENEKGAGRIVQYDFQSNKIQDYVVSNIATITCRAGYLFMGEWEQKEEDAYYYFTPFSESFYANSYIEEKQFGKQVKKLVKNNNGNCRVGDVKMYFHEHGYFSTEPVFRDYPGTSIGHFTLKDKELDYQSFTEQEKKNRSILLEKIGNIEHKLNPSLSISEYQSGEYIYGVCNIFEDLVTSRPIKPKDVIRSYYYKINLQKDEVVIMAQKNYCLGIAISEFESIYQKDNLIIQQNLKTGNEKVIYTIRNPKEIEIHISGNYLLVVEKRNMFPSEKKNCSLVRWNIE